MMIIYFSLNEKDCETESPNVTDELRVIVVGDNLRENNQHMHWLIEQHDVGLFVDLRCNSWFVTLHISNSLQPIRSWDENFVGL